MAAPATHSSLDRLNRTRGGRGSRVIIAHMIVASSLILAALEARIVNTALATAVRITAAALVTHSWRRGGRGSLLIASMVVASSFILAALAALDITAVEAVRILGAVIIAGILKIGGEEGSNARSGGVGNTPEGLLDTANILLNDKRRIVSIMNRISYEM